MSKPLRPTVLVATTTRWVPTARLAMALADAGFTLEAVCPPGHPLDLTGVAQHLHAYSGLRPLRSFAKAIAESTPDLIVPGDDLATRYLHQLHQQESEFGKSKGEVSVLIERSLGAPESFPVVSARAGFLKIAQDEGVRSPTTEVIANSGGLRRWADRHGFPMVLKADGSSGGEGVRIANRLDEAERAFRTLGAPPLLARAAKRSLFDRDSALFWPSVLRTPSVVNAQAFSPGVEATSAVACRNGEVLASLHFEVVKKAKSAGHATVLRVIENQEMVTAVERMVRRLCLSGLHGFDFMVEPENGSAHLIEINPRSTQIGHFALGCGRDLPAYLYAAVTGEPVKPAVSMTDKDTIALFPHEWIRDAESPFLRSAYHDVPWQAPKLIRSCVLSRH